MNQRLLYAAMVPLIALALAACGSPFFPARPTPTAAPELNGNGTGSGDTIVADGEVTPSVSAALAFTAEGVVARVPVVPGQRVAAGQLLAQLDTRQLQIELAQADANLSEARAKLNELVHGTTDEDLAAARQNLAAAQAAYAKLQAGPTAADLAAAQAALAAAQQNDALVRAGPTADQLDQLAAQVDSAQALLAQAQAAYDQVKFSSDITMLPQSLQLQQATDTYKAAVAAYKAAREHPTAAEASAADAQVQQAQDSLDRLTPDAAQLQQALSAVQDARDQLAKLQPSEDDRAELQAAVDAAQAARDLAAEQLKEASLVAPFAGTVMTLDIHAGEYAILGAEVMHLADTSAWQIQTTDLTELNIAQVSDGMPVDMTFDAIPDLDLSGHVSQISPYGDMHQGDIVYAVIITPDRQDPRLRWHMTAKVNIEPK